MNWPFHGVYCGSGSFDVILSFLSLIDLVSCCSSHTWVKTTVFGYMLKNVVKLDLEFENTLLHRDSIVAEWNAIRTASSYDMFIQTHSVFEEFPRGRHYNRLRRQRGRHYNGFDSSTDDGLKFFEQAKTKSEEEYRKYQSAARAFNISNPLYSRFVKDNISEIMAITTPTDHSLGRFRMKCFFEGMPTTTSVHNKRKSLD